MKTQPKLPEPQPRPNAINESAFRALLSQQAPASGVARAAMSLWDGDATAAVAFLNSTHPLLNGLTPVQAAQADVSAVERLIFQADAAVAI